MATETARHSLTIELKEDGPESGHVHMARDAALLDLAEQGVLACRVYSWSEPWITLGAQQDAKRDLLGDSVPHAMRPTGGLAVLHGHDVTVGLAAPLDLFTIDSRSLKAVYRGVIAPLVTAMNDCGCRVALAEQTRFAKGPKTAIDCFAAVSPNDIVDIETGLKACGCALKVTRTAVLLQASLPSGPPLVDPRALFAGPAAPVATKWQTERFAEFLENHLRAL